MLLFQIYNKNKKQPHDSLLLLSGHIAQMATWRSKLGNEFDKATIDRNDEKTKAEIDRLRRLPENRLCADCGTGPTVWASVNLGVFLCIRCGSLHRAIGTHISKPKGCTGTYLWGPDEVERMQSMGNYRANQIYGGDKNHERPGLQASDAIWRQFLVEKYEQRRFAPPPMHHDQAEGNPVAHRHTATVEPKKDAAMEGLISFDDDKAMPTSRSLSAPPPQKGSNEAKSNDFFSEFGL